MRQSLINYPRVYFNSKHLLTARRVPRPIEYRPNFFLNYIAHSITAYGLCHHKVRMSTNGSKFSILFIGVFLASGHLVFLHLQCALLGIIDA